MEESLFCVKKIKKGGGEGGILSVTVIHLVFLNCEEI